MQVRQVRCKLNVGSSLANDGASLGVADKHASDEIVGLRLHPQIPIHVLMHPDMHLVQRILHMAHIVSSLHIYSKKAVVWIAFPRALGSA